MSDQIFYHSYHNRDRLVHIVDNDPGTCEALSVLFPLEGFQTRFSTDTETFRLSFESRSPDIVVLNLRDREQDTFQTLTAIKDRQMGIPVFVLLDQADVDGAVDAMKLGATDVFVKPLDNEKLMRSVRDALRRDVHLGAVKGGRRPVEVRGFNQLTPRERDVLQRISNGQSNKEAGRELGISPRTVEVHMARVMEKLGARNTADLMRIVLTG
ncbi:MAG: response regulator [Hyphomicrobiaceae bacterium]|nr:response regulator [Hyphomicrobiaceae bacterium]MCC0022875.1 response regulator [Hyphomicrobiaceae bacterium]